MKEKKHLENIISERTDKALSEMSKRQKAQQAIDRKRVKTLLIMSAENPMGQLTSESMPEIPRNNPNSVCKVADNEERTDIYAERLKRHQFCYFPAKGKYGNIDYSFIAYNIALDDAMRLGRYFDQRDIIFGEVTEQGTVAFSLYRKDESEFATVKDKTRQYCHKETIEEHLPIASDANNPLDTCLSASLQNIVEGMAWVNDLVEERSQAHWSYATRYQRNLDESISDHFTPWGRRQRRSTLWGSHYELDCNAYERAFPENKPR